MLIVMVTVCIPVVVVKRVAVVDVCVVVLVAVAVVVFVVAVMLVVVRRGCGRCSRCAGRGKHLISVHSGAVTVVAKEKSTVSIRPSVGIQA